MNKIIKDSRREWDEVVLRDSNGQTFSLRDLTFMPAINDNREDILDYLFDEDFLEDMSTGLPVIDLISGKPISALGDSYFDGMYRWTDVLSAYVLLHNVDLPEHFKNHILNCPKQHKVLSCDWRAALREAEPFVVKTRDYSWSDIPSEMSFKEKMDFVRDCPDKKTLMEKIQAYRASSAI